MKKYFFKYLKSLCSAALFVTLGFNSAFGACATTVNVGNNGMINVGNLTGVKFINNSNVQLDNTSSIEAPFKPTYGPNSLITATSAQLLGGLPYAPAFLYYYTQNKTPISVVNVELLMDKFGQITSDFNYKHQTLCEQVPNEYRTGLNGTYNAFTFNTYGVEFDLPTHLPEANVLLAFSNIPVPDDPKLLVKRTGTYESIKILKKPWSETAEESVLPVRYIAKCYATGTSGLEKVFLEYSYVDKYSPSAYMTGGRHANIDFLGTTDTHSYNDSSPMTSLWFENLIDCLDNRAWHNGVGSKRGTKNSSWALLPKANKPVYVPCYAD